MDRHEEMMLLALKEAKKAYLLGEIPVGCVITSSSGEVIATGHNCPISSNDPSAHAEIVALRKAGEVLLNYRFPECSLYVTLEPCCMCVGAIVNARIGRVFYGAREPKFGACGSVFNLIDDPCHYSHPDVTGGILNSECSSLIQEFFIMRRLQKKSHS